MFSGEHLHWLQITSRQVLQTWHQTGTEIFLWFSVSFDFPLTNSNFNYSKNLKSQKTLWKPPTRQKKKNQKKPSRPWISSTALITGTFLFYIVYSLGSISPVNSEVNLKCWYIFIMSIKRLLTSVHFCTGAPTSRAQGVALALRCSCADQHSVVTI